MKEYQTVKCKDTTYIVEEYYKNKKKNGVLKNLQSYFNVCKEGEEGDNCRVKLEKDI